MVCSLNVTYFYSYSEIFRQKFTNLKKIFFISRHFLEIIVLIRIDFFYFKKGFPLSQNKRKKSPTVGLEKSLYPARLINQNCFRS